MLTLDGQGLADAEVSPGDPAREVLLTVVDQQVVQLCKGVSLRDRDQMIAAEVADLAFYSTFLVATGRVAERGIKLPVGAKQHESLSLLPAMAAQDLLDGAGQVIIAKPAE